MNPKYQIFTFLYDNATTQRTPLEWAKLLGFDIVDWDGWKGANTAAPLGLTDFVQRAGRCTINPHK